jgi:hypothetical protein
MHESELCDFHLDLLVAFKVQMAERSLADRRSAGLSPVGVAHCAAGPAVQVFLERAPGR